MDSFPLSPLKLLSLVRDLDLIAGQLNEQLDCQVKLDSGASHTFVSWQLVECLNSKVVSLQLGDIPKASSEVAWIRFKYSAKKCQLLDPGW